MEKAQLVLPKLLIIDDAVFVREILIELLGDKYSCSTATCEAEVLEAISKETFDVVLSDIDLGDTSGIDLVPKILASSPDTTVIMISGNQTIDHAIGAMRVGAFDYVKKPFDLDYVDLVVSRALEHSLLLKHKRNYEMELELLVKKRTEELEYLSYHDVLTDLPNRTLFEDRLSQSLLSARQGERIAVAYASLDGFKKIQDTLGHSPAGLVLKEVSSRLQSCLGEAGTVSRIDGDEFAVLIPHLESDQELAGLAECILERIKEPIVIDSGEVYLTASIGISLFPADGNSPAQLLKSTGSAVLRAREQGGNNYQFYTSGMNQVATHQLALESGLRRAIEREEFHVYYQPKVNTNSGELVGMEALVRWQHPELGLVSPTEFIPIAEDSGMIVPLGEWVLRQACVFTRRLHTEGKMLSVAVNLSARQLKHPSLADTIISILDETGLDANYLNLEITESSILVDAEGAVDTLSRLKAIGTQLSLDDFGTGYSSLGHLKKLPIDVLKIDKSFIQDVTTDADDASLVMAMVTLAHNLRLKVVAEGIETPEQLSFLNLLRCDEFQGYLYSRPLCEDEFYSLANNVLAEGRRETVEAAA